MTDGAELRALRYLAESPQLTQRDLSRALGLSLGKTNYCVRALLQKGLVKARRFQASGNKRGYAYLLTPEGMAAKAQLTRQFLAQKMKEYDALRVEIEELRRESEERGAPDQP